ncbi:hypothetical protein F3N06_14350 [Salmonella enterica]|nr:hypothetical protein [Salmonella enterica subsp. enterica serovar London]ECV6769795.1 hypothetical protein [Salmonella enterica]MGB62400.1 hypothetical protein [Salmonella enterica]
MLAVNTHGFTTGDDFHYVIPLKVKEKVKSRMTMADMRFAVICRRIKADCVLQRRKPGCHRLSDGPAPGYPPEPVPVPDAQ